MVGWPVQRAGSLPSGPAKRARDCSALTRLISSHIFFQPPLFQLINGVVGALLTLLFCAFRNRAWARKFYAPKEYLAKEQVAPFDRPSRLKSSFLGWAPDLASRGEDEVIATAGVDALVFLRVASLGTRLFTAISIWCVITCLTTNLAGKNLSAVAARRADPGYTKYLYWVPPPPANASTDKKAAKAAEKPVPTPNFYVEDIDLPPPPPGLKWWKYADGVPILPQPETELGPEYARYGWRYDPASAETAFAVQDIDRATMANVSERSPTLWVHALTTVAVTLYTLWTLATFSKDAVRLRLRYLSSATPGTETHTVLVTDVPGVRGGTVRDALDRTVLHVLPASARAAVHKSADAVAGTVSSPLSALSSPIKGDGGASAFAAPASVEADPWAKATRRLGDGANATQMVAAEFNELYPGEVEDVQAVYNTAGGLDGALAEYEKIKAHVTHLLDVYTAKARRAAGGANAADDLAKVKRKVVKAVGLLGRPVYGAWGAETYGKGKATTIDAVDLGLARMEYLAGVIKSGQVAAVADPNPAAFVTFKTRRSQVLATEMLQHHDTSAWCTQAAPEPRSVIWPALRQRAWEQRVRFWVTWVAFFAMCLLFMIPVGKIQSLLTPGSLGRVPGFSAILNAPFLSGIIIGILPSLALIIFIALMPPILRLMCKFQGMRTEGDIDQGVVTKFFIFQIFIVFFGTFVAGSFFERAKVWAQDPVQGLKAIGTGAPAASTFFLSYTAIKALFAPAFKHLRIIPFAIYGIKTSLASTERAKARTWSEQWFKYGVDIPQMTMVMLLGLVFCAINPILPPVCLLYFLVVGFFNKYRVLYVARPTYQTGGQMWLAVFNHGKELM